MKSTTNGVEIQDSSKKALGVMFFDDDALFIAINDKSIKVRNVQDDMLQLMGHFFYFLGKNEGIACRIDFRELTIRFVGSKLMFVGKTILTFEPVSLSELKKLGTWLKKRD